MKQLINPAGYEPGYYWGKVYQDKEWNLIIRIEGEPPFQQMTAWDLDSNVIENPTGAYVDEIGPQIEKPE